jgi:hypothetical protein
LETDKRSVSAMISDENYEAIFIANHTFFYYLSLLLSVCAFCIVVLIRFYPNKKMLLLIPDNNFLMDGTTQARPGDGRWRRTR